MWQWVIAVVPSGDGLPQICGVRTDPERALNDAQEMARRVAEGTPRIEALLGEQKKTPDTWYEVYPGSAGTKNVCHFVITRIRHRPVYPR